MSGAPFPVDEAARLECLASLHVLDTEPEPVFDQITALAAELCGTPISLVSLIDAERQWILSNLGMPGVRVTSRHQAFCAHAILSDDVLEIPDTSQDARFATNPLVSGDPHIGFYAGSPLVMPGGERLGTLCVIDRVPRRLSALQRSALTGLARIVTTTLAERRQRLELTGRLATAEATYRVIVEGQTELISLADREGRLTYVNAAYAHFFGLEIADMIGRSLYDFVAAEDRPAVAGHLERVWTDDTTSTTVNRMHLPDGRERWMAWTNRSIRDDVSQARAIHSVGRDVTEQRAAERALAESREQHRLLYESTPAMLHSIDPEGRIVNVTDAWLHRMGYRREEVLGRRSSEFLTQESARYARDVVLPAFFLAGRCDDVAYQMVRSDGTLLDVLLSAVLERDTQGQAVRSLAVVQDVTERRRQQALIERALAEKETLLKEVYHRVKNNLQVVQSLLNLQLHVLPAGLAHDVILDSAQRIRAMALVHEKLYQSGNLAAISLVEYTADLIVQIAEAHGVDRSRIRLQCDIADVQTGLDSAVPYGLLLTELVTNSLKHAFPGSRGGTVHVSLARLDDGDLLTVSDDGVGFPAEADTLGRSASMGLKLAQSLARQLGGELQTRSEGGATSSVLLTRL